MKKLLISRLKDCRKKLNLRAEYVADLIQLNTDELLKIESGKITPDPRTIEELSKIYGCSLEYLYSNDETEKQLILARNGDDLSEFDKKQINEFLAFQKEISKLHKETNQIN